MVPPVRDCPTPSHSAQVELPRLGVLATSRSPAVDRKHSTADETRTVGRQVRDGVRDLRRKTDAAERVDLGHLAPGSFGGGGILTRSAALRSDRS